METGSKKSYVYATIGFALFLAFFFGYYYSDKFYPRTFIGGVAVSGMTYAEAQAKIKTELEDIGANGFNLEFIKEAATHKVSVPASISGFTPDTVVEYFSINNIDETIKKAYDRGRGPSFVLRWGERISSLFFKKAFTVPYSIQKEAVFSLLERELNGFLKGPQTAEFSESGNKIIISEGKFGADIDYERVIKEMDKVLFNASAKSLRFDVNLIAPSITAEDLKLKLDFVNALIGSVDLKLWNDPYWWRARGPILATWLTINKDDEDKIEIRSEKLKNFVEINTNLLIDGRMVNSRFEMQNGKLAEIVPGQAGLGVNFDKLKADIEKELQRIYQNYNGKKIKPETLAVKFTIEKVLPKVTKETIEQYKITNLIGEAKTSFAGSSAARIHNIKVGVLKLNGILIAPGEEFSTVKAIGEVTEKEGYKKEFVIKLDKSVEEFGGGLCQIATTLFRLALNTGLPITERQNHSYVVGYYGPGLDATIYGPHPDLRFVNDTGNYVLLQGMVKNNDLIFELYGRKDGRKVSISEPRIRDRISPPDTKYILTDALPLAQKKCTERRREGLTAETDYRVEYADSSIHEQTFFSEYKPWQEVCLFGTRF
ncbi:MAG: VanW family protein [bacterium]|nr:VanW family protein [bacterium]